MYRYVNGTVDEIDGRTPVGDEHVWLNLVNPTDEEVRNLLGKEFGCHPLVVEDVIHFGQRPKLDHYLNHPIPHAFISFYSMDANLHATEFCVVISKRFVITVAKQTIPFLEQIHRRVLEDPDMLRSTGTLLYRILDECVDDYFIIMDDLEDRLDRMEQRVFHHPEKQSPSEIFRLKRRLHRIRRIATDGRNVIGALSHESFPFTDDRHTVYFVDVYDHASRVVDALDGVRDSLSGLLDLQAAQRANRMNEVMKTLTIISTIFLPLSFIVGLYGMNVKVPEYNWTYGYLWVWFWIVAVSLGLYLYFKKRGWW